MTHYEDIYEVAANNYGLITSLEARELSISDKEMSALAKRGRIARIGHGVYRLTHYIPTPYDTYAEAVKLVGVGAYLYGETVIALLELAPTNPTRIFVATPARIRRALPEHIVVKRANDAFTHYEGIPSQNIADAVRVCINTMMPERLNEAIEEARRQGYIDETQKIKLMNEVECA